MLDYGKFVDIKEGMRYDFSVIHMIEEYFRKEGKDKKECERYTESFKKRVREALKEEDRRLEEEDLWNYNDEGDRRWCKTIFEGTYSDEVMERYRFQEWWHNRFEGQWYTEDIKIFKVVGNTVVYHIQHRDI